MVMNYHYDSNGLFHRLDGPAVIKEDGTKAWYVNGTRHREDGPAIIFPDGTEEWIQNGKLHRIDGPALVSHKGEQWFSQGIRHRIDGPALTLKDYKEWWINGENMTVEVIQWMKDNNFSYPFSEHIKIQFLMTFG